MNALKLCLLLLICVLACGAAFGEDEEDLGYLYNPPVYIISEPDFVLTGLGPTIPPPGTTIPIADITSLDSDGFRKNGEDVQPQLSVKSTVYRFGALHGCGSGWAAGISIPWVRTRVRGQMGGFPTSGTADGFGDIDLVAKKQVLTRGNGSWVVAAGIELPTGKDDVTFGQSNAATNAYYRGFPQRMPLSWQAGSGSVDGFLGLSYGGFSGRVSYALLFTTKLHSSGDEDVKIGNIFIAAGSTTYGLSKTLAAALGITARFQADDDYPNAPPPGVDFPPVDGTTLHGTTVYIDPSIRYSFKNRVTIGVGYKIPVVKPDNGMVPQAQFSLIFYPSF